MRKFAVSDIHGCCKTLRSLVENKLELKPQDELYLLGDYIDRGPDSKGVFDYIFQLQAAGYKVFTCKGNHEEIMLQAKIGEWSLENWYKNGGIQTLKSFGVDKVEDVPDKYFKFMESLTYYYEVDDYILVHAGLGFEVDNPLDDLKSMLWIRNFEIDYQKLGNRTIVHGHTPMSMEVIEQSFAQRKEKQIIPLDNGCVYLGKKEKQGNLLAFDMTNESIISHINID